MSDYAMRQCGVCGNEVTVRRDGLLVQHWNGRGGNVVL